MDFSFIGGLRNLVYIFHAFIVGPFMMALGYYSNEYSSEFEKYDDEIKLGLKILFWTGIVVIIYHSHKLLLNSKRYNKIFNKV